MTLRARREVGSLRRPRTYGAIKSVIARSSTDEFRVAHFTVQGDHLHLVLEADGHASLSRGMRSLVIRMALAINEVLGRSGSVWADRYHRRDLETPREVRNALAYVYGNAEKHGRAVAPVDLCSSARWFDGWREPVRLDVDAAFPDDPSPVARPKTWLLKVGWRKHGLLSWTGRSG